MFGFYIIGKANCENIKTPDTKRLYKTISLFNRSFGGVFVLSCCFLDFSVGVGDLVIELSKISSFFS